MTRLERINLFWWGVNTSHQTHIWQAIHCCENKLYVKDGIITHIGHYATCKAWDDIKNLPLYIETESSVDNVLGVAFLLNASENHHLVYVVVLYT